MPNYLVYQLIVTKIPITYIELNTYILTLKKFKFSVTKKTSLIKFIITFFKFLFFLQINLCD